MAPRTAVALCLLASCDGFKMSQPLDGRLMDNARQLGQTNRQTKRIGSEADESPWVGEVLAAERVAQQARDAALKAEEEAGSTLSGHQLEAIDRHATAEFSKEVGQAGKLDHVVDSMEREGDAAQRVISKLERRTRHVTTITQEERKRNLAIDRDIRKLDKADEEEAEKEDSLLRSAVKSEHALERKEAGEFNKAQREMREAKKIVEGAMAKEREYTKKRANLEAATSARLWKQAEAMRNESADASLSQDDILRLLDISADSLNNMTGVLAKFSKENSNQTGAWLDQRLEGIRHKSTASSAHLLEAITHKVNVLHESHLEYDNHQLMRLVVKLLNETRGEVKMLHEQSSQVSSRVEQWNQANPEKLSTALALALNGVTGNIELRNHFYSIDTELLAQATGPQACEMLGELLLAKWEAANSSLTLMKKGIDNLAKVVPSTLAEMPYAAKVMENRTNVLLNMAYAEHIALKETATTISADLAPLIIQRFHCALSGATRLGGLGVAAVAAAAALLLS